MNKPQRSIGSSLGSAVAAVMNRWKSLDPERLPLLGKLTLEQRSPAVLGILLTSLLLATLFMVWYTVQEGRRASYVETSTRLQMLSQRYAKTAQQAVLGNHLSTELGL